MIEEPTRDENILDLVCTNKPEAVIRYRVVPGISDHDCPLVEFDLNPVRRRSSPRKIPVYRRADWTNFADHLEKIGEDISRTAGDTPVSNLWKKLKDGIAEGVQRYIPHKNTRKLDSLPFVTPEIRKLIRKRDRMYDRMKTANKDVFQHDRAIKAKQRFKELKQEVQRKLRRSYWQYVESVVTPLETEPGMKRFWSFIRHMRTDNCGIAALKEDGKTLTDPKSKADACNRQFESVFTEETPLTGTHTSKPQLYPSCPDITITCPGVVKLLSNLKAHKAPGPDGLSPRVLKEMATTIGPILTVIYQRSYDTGVVPEDWRSANVVPVYKKGNRTKPSNYRPISLTCIVCKVMEHIITSNIMAHAERHQILYDLQHGFRSKLSCETQLVEFATDISNNMQNRAQTDVLVMDFSKAFDRVGHERLLTKLRRYGLTGNTARWIENFLAGRTQRVVLEDAISYTAQVRSGVPQGSVLGPSLFLLYINDMPENITSTVRLFADDTICYLAIASPTDANTLQGDLDKLATWETDWQMNFHPDKCQVLRITRNRSNIIEATYTLHGHTLEVVDCAKYLGVSITKDLNWSTHINNTTRKANSTLAFLRRNIRISSPSIKSAAYKALVRPVCEYASTVWDPYTDKLTHQLEKVQRRSARWVVNRYHNTSSVSCMLQKLNWTSLSKRRQHARLTMLYKLSHGLVRVNTTTRLVPLPHHSSTRRAHSHCYAIPHSTTQYHKFSFYPRTITTWNKLPAEVVNAPSLDSFRARLTGM